MLVLLADLVAVSDTVASTRSRTQKTTAIADALRLAEPTEVETVVAYLSGELRQRRTGVGWAALRDLPAPATTASLTVADVHDTFEEVAHVSGTGSAARRRELLQRMFDRATSAEQEFLVRLVGGELRQGALDGLMQDAIARAADLPLPAVRRAIMMRGATGPVAAAALTGGAGGLEAFALVVGRPLKPMLASSAPDVPTAMDKIAKATGQRRVAADTKLDGIRIQVHRDGPRVRIYTRSLDDITDRLPEVVEAVLALEPTNLVLDGEAIALDADGRPHPFQVTAARTATTADIAAMRARWPVTAYFFDLLHRDGTDLVDRPGAERFAALEESLPAELVVPRVVSDQESEVGDFFAAAVRQGHEGVVVKSLEAVYEAGRRGAAWVKVKPRHTLDLVVLAAEWGHGRRRGWLSNLHLGARDPRSGGFVMLGKTFKGMTDELLEWQTGRLRELQTAEERHVVYVRPELVVEIAFDGVQTSTRYPGGVALRFARVLRYREDKTADEADTIDEVVAIRDGRA